MNKLLTVFTPAYNRSHTLNKCYESLKRQTCKDFKWLIIDDGSTDNTKELVECWKNENNDFEIKYIYQKNQGMHGAHNTAYENIDTELNICIDSDDYLTDFAIEEIKNHWNKVKCDNLSGIIGLDSYKDGKIIGDKFPENMKTTTVFDFYYNKRLTGDKKIVYRTELTKMYPYPIFEGEKYVGLAYKYYKLDEKYELSTLNKVLCVVEYLEDGSSVNMFKQYINNPRGFAFYRRENMSNSKASFKYSFQQCIHYVSSSIIANNSKFFKESPKKGMTLMAIPFGVILYLYIMKNVSKKMKLSN